MRHRVINFENTDLAREQSTIVNSFFLADTIEIS